MSGPGEITVPVPSPRRGGTRLYCPVVDVAASELAGDGASLVMCAHPSRRPGRAGRKALARHFRRDHLAVFRGGGPGSVLSYLIAGEWCGMRGIRAQVTVSMDR